MMRPPAPTGAWYIESSTIDRWVCGVFEGGGAKGVAFTGALLGLRDLRCWFGAVAGASAGAITAALIAAGLTPEEIDQQTEAALQNVRTDVWKGVFRLQEKTGYFPSDQLTEWLDSMLLKRVSRTGDPNPQQRVTFRELYQATGIELNVVAADLSLRRQIVFSHQETPACAVADAVAASSAIPFAFPSRLLAVADSESGQIAHHTIVDGGVWSNFPMFIFEDQAFRTMYEREPRVIEPDRIVGFLLDEGAPAQITRGEDILFASQRGDKVVRAREWVVRNAPEKEERPSLGARMAAWMLWPFALLGRAVELNGKVELGRWPRPRSQLVRNLLHGFNGLFSATYPPLFGLIAIFAVGLGAWQIIAQLVEEQLRVWPATDWRDLMSWWVRPVTTLLALIVIFVVTLATFAAALGVLANRILLRATRRLMYGLASTYVAGPGAPEWATRRPNIVALPIPQSVGTLSFDLPAELRTKVVADARAATLEKVGALLDRPVAATS